MEDSMNNPNGMNNMEEYLQTPVELLQSLTPQVQDLNKFLEYPRELMERALFEREDYWTRILSAHERTAMIDYIREISYALAWDIYSEVDVSDMPQEFRNRVYHSRYSWSTAWVYFGRCPASSCS